ncbi:DNA gyrase subunit A [Candidatus Amarolinea dominans]|uniref:DNA gyrase subunit A n=1 Tax=Candidatus Amarolinea dominans TaxID=3140696 RepID=UPI0031CC4A52
MTDELTGLQPGTNGVDLQVGTSGVDPRIGKIQPIDIDVEMRSAYLDYAMSVIVARALPDARDGLKPVHRRILYAMHDMGMRPGTAYKKSARIVGEVLGKYHPHGDVAVYDSMVRLAQDFSMRYLLIDGQGNFGSIDGDSPAAMRYTEARLARLSDYMLGDIEKETVDWGPNFDDSLEEPTVLPAQLPNLLLNGSSGIAVGMATNIPPHNLAELADAIAYLIERWEQRDDVTVEDLMELISGPDFPTGGLIMGTEGIRSAYATGKGRIIMRGVASIEDTKGGRFRIIVTEIPYQLNKTTLLERIAQLVREERLDQISDLRDESDREGMRIVIELKRSASARKVLSQIYKLTPLQSTFGVNLLALVEGEPRLLSLRRALQIYVEHRQEVLTRRTRFELRKAQERAHILEGLRIALQFLDEVIALIRASKSADDARTGLMTHFNLSEVQAQAILDMQLRRLAALERAKIEAEYQEMMARIAHLRTLLDHPEKILEIIKTDILELKEKFGDRRRTQILPDGSADDEDVVPQEHVLVTLTQDNFVKRTLTRVYRAQGRGGRGVVGMNTRDEDQVVQALSARTLDFVLFFTNKGRIYSERAFNLPDASRTGKGLAIVNFINLPPDERVTAMVAVPDFEHATYVTMATVGGRIKRVELSEFSSVRPNGIIAMPLEDGDELGWARVTSGKQELILVTEKGQALRFDENEVRAMGRTASGVWGIRLGEGDRVTSLDVIEPGGDLLVVTPQGFGKRSSLSEYTPRGRYTGGVVTLSQSRLEKDGRIVSSRVVQEDEEVAFFSAGGIALRLRVRDIPRHGRASSGVRLVQLKKDDTVAVMVRLGLAPTAEPVTPTAALPPLPLPAPLPAPLPPPLPPPLQIEETASATA